VTIAWLASISSPSRLTEYGAHFYLSFQEYVKQNKVLVQLTKIALAVHQAPKDREKVQQVLHEGLEKVQLPDKFRLPLDPRVEVSSLIVKKCKAMDSKKV